MPKHKFLPGQEDFIIANRLTMSANAIGLHCKCDGAIVLRFLAKKGLSVPKEIRYKLQAEKRKGITTFTKEQDDFIVANYLTIPIKTLGDKIGRSYTGIMNRLLRMGLTIPPEIIERNKKSAQIQPGHEPANKGKKQVEYMSLEQIAKTVGTRFKKGQISHNAYDEDGVITTRYDHKERGGRAYKYIRISLGKWKPYHTHLWEQENGPLPKGHCLWFIDGDPMNCELSNLELITRKENFERNSGSTNLSDKYVATKIASKSRKVDQELKKDLLNHPEILNLKRQEILLSRAIKENERPRK